MAILFGGKSAEHEVSLQSAQSVLAAINREKYDPVLIGIDKGGRWHLHQEGGFLQHPEDPALISLSHQEETVTMLPWERDSRQLTRLSETGRLEPVDVVFPILHGPYGEDGTIQGLLKLAGVPFVGSGVLGSAVAMDKDFSKQILQQAGLPVAPWRVLRSHRSGEWDFGSLRRLLGLPFFVKPANLGSSVGVHKVGREEDFHPALRDAFQYDRKILVEQYVEGREIECSVLGNNAPEASVLGEIVPRHEFYSYEAKYLDENGALLKVPAQLPKSVTREIQQLAVQAFVALDCAGLARADFFYSPTGGAIINELNTMPGFTRISMYPRLWKASGVPYSELIDRLIDLALERDQSEKNLKTSFTIP